MRGGPGQRSASESRAGSQDRRDRCGVDRGTAAARLAAGEFRAAARPAGPARTDPLSHHPRR